ncbi:MAG: FxsA family protein [Thiomicrospira sp.]|uniref:FxsA family protein n=1 Tax=Thiomicrospira sp. TaxID=935 RepID=UPI0019E79F30|nr:FxsA family protein [Thiomicrospira sp.]MBE0494158.1 FxsA family protein [Thiomicrospira sp.]
MFKVFFMVFIVVPLLELYLLIEVGSQIGALPTILLTILTALVGGLLMKHQGLQVVQQAQMAVAKGEAPQQQVIEGMMIFIGGAMLLLPGLVTDFIGFLFLLPPVRVALAKRWLAKRARNPQGFSYVRTEWTVKDGEPTQVRHYESSNDANVIEGEVLESDDKKSDRDDRPTR